MKLKMDKKTLTSTEQDKEVVERVYHIKEIKELLDKVLEDYIIQVAVMSDEELVFDRSKWMKTIGREIYDNEELERHSHVHSIAIELEQIRRFGRIVYDV